MSQARDLFSLIEAAEADAWEEIQRSSPPAFRDEFGVTVHRVRGAVLVASRAELASLNRLWLPGSAKAPVEEVLDEAIDCARSAGSTKLLIHCPPWAADSKTFEQRGLRPTTPMTKLYRQPASSIDHACSLRIETIGAADSGRFATISTIASDMPPSFGSGFNSTIGSDGWIHYMAFDGDEPVAVAGLRVYAQAAWCCMAATLKSHRGRGAQSALLARRIRDAAIAGCSWVTCESISKSPEEPSDSKRNMLRAGFVPAYDRLSYVCDLGVGSA